MGTAVEDANKVSIDFVATGCHRDFYWNLGYGLGLMQHLWSMCAFKQLEFAMIG